MCSPAKASNVVVTEDGPVWTICLNRPARLNALNPEAIALFREAMLGSGIVLRRVSVS